MAKKTENNTNLEQKGLYFSAIDAYVATNIVDGSEKVLNGYNFIAWGEHNDYPDYLVELYRNVPSLQTIINGATDYTCGDDVQINVSTITGAVNTKNEGINTIVRQIAMDWWLYGAFALNIVRNKLGGVAAVYYLNVKNIRSDKKGEMFYYADDWKKSYGRVKYAAYPKFDAEKTDLNSVLYVKNNYNGTYGIPVYAAATKAAEIMRSIDEYHLNSINNGLTSSYIISFNNGQPAPEIQEQIEEEFNDKFTGKENAGRIMLCFNKSKENETTVQKIDADNWADKYKGLADWAEKQLYISFRASKVLFGMTQEGTGFNDQDYMQAFKLFNRTMILPVQRIICDTFEKIYGVKGCMTIKPFSINWGEEEDNNEIVK